MRILLVSGHPTVSQQVRNALLGHAGAEIFEVSQPRRAIALLEAGEAFDLVIGDNDTHPAGGLVLARDVRDLGRMGKLVPRGGPDGRPGGELLPTKAGAVRATVPPVLLLLARQADTWLANWAQADAWVLKPPDPFHLVETVEALVGRRPVPALPGTGGDPTPSLLDVVDAPTAG